MSETVNIDGLADAIMNDLKQYSDDVTAGVKKAVDITAKETNKEIKNHIAFKQHTGDYVKAFRTKTTYEDQYNKRKTWYVKSPEYRLTHLIENGHATVRKKNGKGRTQAFPHIKYGAELAEKRMEELAKEAIENAGH